MKKSTGRFVALLVLARQKYARIVDANESTRKGLEGTLHTDHEDHIAGKGIKSLNHYNLVHKFIPMPQSNENTGSKSSSGESMGKTLENTSVANDGSQKQERCDR